MRVWAFPSFYPFDKENMRWRGIFAHRQYKGLQEVGADIQVIMPVLWHPPFPISELFKDWKEARETGYPLHTQYDGITVHYPRIENLKPNRLMKKSYRERYAQAVKSVFDKLNIKPTPQTDVFYSQWLPESVYVQHTAHQMGLKSGILSIGDDVVVWPRHTENNLKAFTELMQQADYRFACADYLGREANNILK
ncbi:MAG: hypothetical protein EBX41_08220, partial [Chitinophagia bacterium]|nr:hypothetical protein [Chitinophagia bacterium]